VGFETAFVDQAKSTYLKLRPYVHTVTDSNAILKRDPKPKSPRNTLFNKNDVCGASEETAKK
jgi:hypothetical protein